MIEPSNCRLEFLPPYSPDFNPIEYSFACLKRELKSGNYMLDNEEHVLFAQEIIRAATKAITADICRNQFRHCGFRIQE